MQSQNIYSSILNKFSHSSEAEAFLNSLNQKLNKLENKVIELQKETVTLRQQLNKGKEQKKQKALRKQCWLTLGRPPPTPLGAFLVRLYINIYAFL